LKKKPLAALRYNIANIVRGNVYLDIH